ncbi:MAG: hypothetical protein J6N45_06550 [Alphaproteobacteria bacterium]|nr:hypothetical protein [Alphaproteobacteria bacterium]
MKKILMISYLALLCGCTAVFWENFGKNPSDILQNAETFYKNSNFDDAYELYNLVGIFCYDPENNNQVKQRYENDCKEEALYIFTKKSSALLQASANDFMKAGDISRYTDEVNNLNANQKTLTAMNEYLKIANNVLKNTDSEILKQNIQESINSIKQKQKNPKVQSEPKVDMWEQMRREELQQRKQEQEKELNKLNGMKESLDKENEALKSKKLF